MVRIPEGYFQMGSEIGQDNERPVHKVYIDAFELAAHQVTNADYAQFLEAAEHPKPPHWDDPKFNNPNQPVVATSWFDASAYCSWLTRITGRRYRLPSEAEWERAARGGVEGKAYPWGDEPPESLLDYHLRWIHGPDPVERSNPNPYGLYEMCENVHEWCADWYEADYYSAHPEKNPARPRRRLATLFARRFLAPLHPSLPLRRPQQHPPRLQICRLRLPRSPRQVAPLVNGARLRLRSGAL